MSIKLNLLPPELAVDKRTGGILKSIRAFNLILIAFFIVFTIGLSVYFVFTSVILKNKLASVESLKGKIKTLQTSEQQIVLLKDRIKKIVSAQNKPSAIKNLDMSGSVLSTLSGDSQITEMNVDIGKIVFLISFRTTSDLTNFFENLSKTTTFKSAILSSFGFNPLTGYLAGVSIVPADISVVPK